MAGLSTNRVFIACPNETGAVGPDTDYFAGVDYETIVKWYYRVKKWRLTIPYTSSASANGSDSSCSSAISGPDDPETSQSASLVTEANLVCISPQGGALLTPESDSDTDSGPNSFCNTSVGYGFTSDAFSFLSFIRKSGGLYYPEIFLNVSLSASADFNDVDGAGEDIRTILTRNVGGDPISIDWTIDGQNFSRNGNLFTSSFNTGGGTTSATCDFGTIDLTPIEYWPYNPGSGGPIWDASTGSQLRDPFSVQSW